MKTSLKLSVLFLTLTAFLYSCIYFKTKEVRNVSASKISAIHDYKSTVIISGSWNKANTFIISEFRVENDSIFGNLKSYEIKSHRPYQRTFRKRKGEKIHEVMHLHTKLNLEEGEFSIAVADIYEVQIHQTNIGLTALSTLGVVYVATVVAVIATCGCPEIEVIGSDGEINSAGSLFPGAMFKMIRRTDYAVLNKHSVHPSDTFKVRLTNNKSEIQYIDEVRLLNVQHPYKELAIDHLGEPISIDPGETPFIVKTGLGTDITELLHNSDKRYDFNEIGTPDQLNSVELTFDRSNLTSNSQLVIKGRQTPWLEQTTEHFFQQFGTSFPKWVEKKNNGNSKEFVKISTEQGIWLNAYVKLNNNWEYIGSYRDPGTTMDRYLALPINLPEDSTIKIKLECAHAFWSLDQVFITDKWSADLDIQTIPFSYAIDQENNNVATALQLNDGSYRIQEEGTFTEVGFVLPVMDIHTLVLKGTGYFNHVRNYNNPADIAALKSAKHDPFASHNLSRMLALSQELQRLSAN